MTVPRRTRAVWALGRTAAALFYRVERLGPPVPDGPVLLVANHPNGLLDPVLVVATSGRVPRFLAKSTLFAGVPYSFLIRWAGAIPVYRRHDEGADPAKNTEMFIAVDRALAERAAVCLFPEGISHSSGRLERLKTGAARIALSAEAAGTAVALVAVGLNFAEKGIFRSPAVIAYGPAFTATDLLDHAAPTSPEAVDALTGLIAERLRDVMIEADPAGDAALVRRVERLYARARELPDDPASRLGREQAVARGLDVLRRRDSERLARLVEALGRHERRLARFALPGGVPERRPRVRDAVRFGVRELPLAAVLGPVCLLAVLAFAVPYRVVDAVATRRSIEHEIQATVKVMGGAIVHTAWMLLLAALAWIGWGAGAGLGAGVGLPALGVAGLFALERETAAWRAVRTWWGLQRISPAASRRLARVEGELAALLDEAHAWVTAAPASGRLP